MNSFKMIARFFSLFIILCSSVACHKNWQNNFFELPSSDTAITTTVLESMLDNEETSTLKVHVETQQGVVRLSGYVKTIRQSDTCEAIAKKTPGVVSVQNDIIVRK